ncbi:sialidase family protein [sulfur-oxidizing endosymbiont of Gigantopelta aegis]|uniref:sialidase family protein n=1 Tax=sulfur-oxidizing endosymbiont of Gigantopelta aegis TaxID=2794934 RepID=UPI0018DDE40E|nr:sialidase family protein [sulfur-oxidizing endosymbiont of Gigantopelta aegis]
MTSSTHATKTNLSHKLVFILGLISLLPITGSLFNPAVKVEFQLSPLSDNSNKTGLDNNKSAKDKSAKNKAFFHSSFTSHESTLEVHSPTAIELANNNVMAFWYGGTREGHQDVSIYQNIWDNSTQQWGQDKELITRLFTRNGTSRYIRKLGNPVVTRGPDNSIWLFYVSVSVGGWAGSAINLTQSHDEGHTWSSPKRLITSPFLNLSTLIKGSAIHYADGSIGLPVYHELLGKFGELLKLNSQGEVIHKTRLSWGQTSLQPIIFPTSEKNAIAMMRYQGPPPNRILIQHSSDAGQSWSAVKKSTLANPGAGIIGLTLNDNHDLLLAYNNDPQERDDLSLAISQDAGETWQLAQVVEKNVLVPPDKSQQFSYPWLLQTQNGNIHLLYTWHKSHIKHAVFNKSWLLSNNSKTAGKSQ